MRGVPFRSVPQDFFEYAVRICLNHSENICLQDAGAPGPAEERGRGLGAQALHPRHLRQHPQGRLQGPPDRERRGDRVKTSGRHFRELLRLLSRVVSWQDV